LHRPHLAGGDDSPQLFSPGVLPILNLAGSAGAVFLVKEGAYCGSMAYVSPNAGKVEIASPMNFGLKYFPGLPITKLGAM
jgi:hypothetical protein